jgi:hypothetical protein
MHYRVKVMGTALTCACSLITMVSSADDLGEKGRAIFKKNQHCVVTVQIVLKSKVSIRGRGGESNESRQEVTGTVLDASGIAVLSLSATDPGQMVQNMMGGGGEDESRLKMETELSDVKMLLEDGTEIPAEVVLRDRDLDLAFIRPKTKLATAMPAVDLTNSGKADVLEEVVTLNRLGKAAGRSYAASVERISAIVQRPRLFYIPEANMTTTTLGAPAFTTNGKLLGIFVMRTAKGTGSSSFGMMGSPSDSFTGIIVPADDVLKAVKQVPAVAEEKAKEKEKEKQ